MKYMKVMILVLPAYWVLNACGARPDPGAVQKSPAAETAPVVTASESNDSRQTADSTAVPSPKVDIADLQAQKADLEAQKASVLSQQKQIEEQKASFANPADLNGAAFGDFMANAQAMAVIDQAVLDDIIQAAMDLDPAALQDAILDLIANLQDLAADLQAQIDDLAAQIAAAQA
ncbi:hypothetical protein [Oligoflexus tunisiensis]|uniref:hypothetical protein n=1 Tax=Oligoflexus tunisiensis TaxID=708132 RepID=UPI00114D2EF5|nr:hypothetical protein [Oligoflexus tunisiensis]